MGKWYFGYIVSYTGVIKSTIYHMYHSNWNVKFSSQVMCLRENFVHFKMFHLKKVSVATISSMESSNFGNAVLIFMHRLCSKVLPVELRIPAHRLHNIAFIVNKFDAWESDLQLERFRFKFSLKVNFSLVTQSFSPTLTLSNIDVIAISENKFHGAVGLWSPKSRGS